MHNLKKNAVIGGVLTIAISVPLTTMAQLEEIVVTAQRREEGVQNIPIAINALAGDLLDDYDIQGADDLEHAFVGITTNNSGAANAGISIRGVGTSSFHVSTQTSVAMYIDNIYQVSPFTSAIGVFDMERVEVLRGPQNTLYGRNTTGGAVNFYSRTPQVGEETNGYARLTGGVGNRLDFEGAVGGSLSDTVAGRIAVASNNLDGVMDARNTGEPVDGRNYSGVRGTLVWAPTDNFSLTAKYTNGSADGDDIAILNDGPLNATGTGPCPDFDERGQRPDEPNDCTVSLIQQAINSTPYLADLNAQGLLPAHPGMAGRKLFAPGGYVYDDVGDGYEFAYDIFNLYLNGQVGNIQVDSITSYLDQYLAHYAAGAVVSFNANQVGDWQVFQQEFRFSSPAEDPFRWVAGVYYSSSESIEDTWVNVPNLPPSPSNSILIDAEFEALSVYGQFDLDLSESVTATFGLRSSDETLAAPPKNGRASYRKFFCHPNPAATVVPGAMGMGTGNTSANIGNEWGRAFRENNPDYCPEIKLGSDPGTNPLPENSFDRAVGPLQELSEVGWNAALSWNATDDVLLYANAGRGFKGGAFDNRALALGDNPISPEFLDSFEIGIKSTLANGTVRFNAAAYTYTWEDIQLFEVLATGPELNNIPAVDSSGIEFDLTWAATEAWFINAQALFADTEITDVTGLSATSEAQVGKQVEGNPEFTFNGTVAYTIPMGAAEMMLLARYRHLGEHFSNLSNTRRGTHPALDTINLRATYSFGTDLQHTVSLFGDNVTGEIVCNGMSNGPGPGDETFGCQVDRHVNGNALWGITFETLF